MLSDAQIRAAKPKDRSYKLFDANQLFLLVTTGGSKLWRLNYKYDGKQKSLALGRYPSLGLAEARRLRDEALAKLREGHDPGVPKKLKLKANIEASRNTFEKVEREWHEVNAPQWAKVHAADVLRSFERDVFPAIGSLRISALTPPKLLEVLRAVEARSVIETAKRLRQRISGVYAYAIASGIAHSDAAEKVGAALKPMAKKGRQPAITDVVELRCMLATVDADVECPVTRIALADRRAHRCAAR